MKYIAIILFFTLFGCHNNPKEILITKASEELKKNMHDPNSFEFVSLEEDIKKQNENELYNKEFDLEPQFQMNSKYFKLKYRGKNKLGALVLNEINIVASNDENLSFFRLED